MAHKHYRKVPKHPLATKLGKVRVSRLVLYKAQNGVAGDCHWCGCKLTWKTLCADHLDSDIENDILENLVSSCRGCNANREDGTGYGRRQPKKCLECKRQFIGISHHKQQIYCSNKCSSKNRPKIGTSKQHGTRGRYTYGCRCTLCRAENAAQSRIYAARKKLKVKV